MRYRTFQRSTTRSVRERRALNRFQYTVIPPITVYNSVHIVSSNYTEYESPPLLVNTFYSDYATSTYTDEPKQGSVLFRRSLGSIGSTEPVGTGVGQILGELVFQGNVATSGSLDWRRFATIRVTVGDSNFAPIGGPTTSNHPGAFHFSHQSTTGTVSTSMDVYEDKIKISVPVEITGSITQKGSGNDLIAEGDFYHKGTYLGFYNATANAKQTVTGSRGGNAALADLLTKLANLGLITDSTS